MKTSISSKAFCSITDRQTDKISQLWVEKITFPSKLDRQTYKYIQTDGHLLLYSSFFTKNKYCKEIQLHLFYFESIEIIKLKSSNFIFNESSNQIYFHSTI